MNAMIETLETRNLMSATTALIADVSEPPTMIGMLLPAVQKVREAAARTTTGYPGGGPVVKAISGSDNAPAGSSHAGGVNVLLMDGSVR